ncbi:MAG TPA: NifB/NifX family molybdenum-iron cluster-binding protein [Candidatus Ozemobacteraceae bacterium]|nr:NifB/NifX family molybdenum-iron cluster-binding protein [Candidatus Ozemobacteraceae bacterium]
MMIAISAKGDTLDAPLDPRLGRAERFLLIDSENESFTVMTPQTAQMSHGAGIQTAQALLKAGVKVVISGDCGPKAFQVFQSAGVPVYSSSGGTIRDVLNAWKKKELPVIGEPGPGGH